MAFWFIVVGDLTYASPPLAPASVRAGSLLLCAFERPKVEVTWQAPLDDGGFPIVAYQIWRDGVPHKLVTGGGWWVDYMLEEETVYSYQVLALNANLEASELSSPAAATTIVCPAGPSEPLNFDAFTGCSFGVPVVYLSWEEPLDLGSGQRVRVARGRIVYGPAKVNSYRLKRDGRFLAWVRPPAALTMTDETVTPGVHTYLVELMNMVGQIGQPAIVTVDVPECS
jgi:hypothetical protein